MIIKTEWISADNGKDNLVLTLYTYVSLKTEVGKIDFVLFSWLEAYESLQLFFCLDSSDIFCRQVYTMSTYVCPWQFHLCSVQHELLSLILQNQIWSWRNIFPRNL